MMTRLDQRGTASWEFILVAVPLFMLMFVIFDLGRYAITVQSLRALADAGARAVMIKCYTPAVTSSPPSSPSGCTTNQLSTAAMQTAAPFLYFGGLTPTLSVTAGSNTLTVAASQAGFAMLMPIWGAALNAPSASTSIPF
jgi:hypothetical protein